MHVAAQTNDPPANPGSCAGHQIQGVDLGLPTWYKYLDCDTEGDPQLDSLNDIWGIGWGVVEIILFVAAVSAVFFIIYGGIQYTISQASPDKLTTARRSIIYGIAGLVIAIIARVVIQFVLEFFGS